MDLTKEEIKNLRALLQSPLEENVKVAVIILKNDCPKTLKNLLKEYESFYKWYEVFYLKEKKTQKNIPLEEIIFTTNSIEELSFQNTDLSQVDLTILKILKNLKKINLHNCKLAELPSVLEEFYTLEELDLSNNPIIMGNLSFLEKLPNLQKFSIWDEKFERKEALNIKIQLKQLKKLKFYSSYGYNGNYLFTQVPLFLNEFTSLEELYFLDNDLSRADFTPLIYLKNLKKLSFCKCKLSCLPLIIERLTSLEELDISKNPILEINYKIFEKLLALQRIWIWNNYFEKEADLDLVRQIQTCKRLDLKECGFIQIPSILRNITTLEELFFSSNYLGEGQIDFTPLANLKNLKSLYLSSCHLKQIPAVISKLTSLEELGISSNYHIGDFTPLTHLKNLKRLDLSRCLLEQVHSSISKLIFLEELNLSENHIKGKFTSLIHLKNLKKVDLRRNKTKLSLTKELIALQQKGVSIVF